jgi:murein DD-endopeptidase MepM/ murein hydrolase activator NlpD
VYAAAPGTVVWSGKKKRYGLSVVLKHSDGYRTRYAHLKKTLVKLGQPVEVGEKIGIVGRTGRATTAHLHFEIIQGTNFGNSDFYSRNYKQNPLDYI